MINTLLLAASFPGAADVEEPALYWVQASYSSDALDILDYADAVSTGARFEDERGLAVGGRMLSGMYFRNHQIAFVVDYATRQLRATRAREPHHLALKQQGLSLGIEARGKESVWHLTAHYTDFPKQTIHKYQYGNLVLGEDITFHDPDTLNTLPLVEVALRESGFSLGLTRRHRATSPTSLSADYRYSRIEADVDSVMSRLTDEDLLNSTLNGRTVGSVLHHILNRLPQNNVWHEHTVRLGLSRRFPFTAHWHIDATAAAYLVKLSDYRSSDASEVKTNATADLALVFRPSTRTEWYLRWHLSSNYTLGVHPGTYTPQTEFLFNHPYSTVSIGFRVPLTAAP